MYGFIKKRPYLFFLLPGFLLYSLVSIYSIVSAIPYSFTRWSGIKPPVFAGLDNYRKIFTDPVMSSQFFNALWNNVQLIFWGFLIMIPLSVLAAYLLFQKVPGHKAMQLAAFSPYFINFVTAGFMVTLFFDPRIGLLSKAAGALGFSWNTAEFFSDTSYGIPYIMMVQIWKCLGYYVLLVYANFTSISQEYVEAAVIDGANRWQVFRRIYFPLLKPSLVNICILHYIWGVSAFEIPYMLGGETGGINGNMDVVGIFFYRTAFSPNNIDNAMGLGTTVATIIFFLVLLGALIQLKLLGAGDMSDE